MVDPDGATRVSDCKLRTIWRPGDTRNPVVAYLAQVTLFCYRRQTIAVRNSGERATSYAVRGSDANAGERAECPVSAARRKRNRRDRMHLRRAIEQQLPERVPYLEAAVLTAAADQVRYRAPGND